MNSRAEKASKITTPTHSLNHEATDPSTASQFSRRGFVKLAGGLLFSSLATAGYARRIEPNWLDVTQLEIPIRNLASHLDGRRIAQLSDIHLSDFVSPEQLAGAVSVINEIQPDWAVLTGDYVSRGAGDGIGLIEPLRELQVPTYVIWGNHDLWAGLTTVQHYMEETPVTILRNSGVRIDANLWLAGLDDVWSGRPDLRASLSGAAGDDTAIALVHEPDFFDRILEVDAPVALQLSGHTHGGQVRLPRLTPDETGLYSWAPVLPRHGQRYPIGLREINNRYVYTNRGLGLWPVRFRINCRPELSVFTLRQA
jgi:uncharacterized protein